MVLPPCLCSYPPCSTCKRCFSAASLAAASAALDFALAWSSSVRMLSSRDSSPDTALPKKEPQPPLRCAIVQVLCLLSSRTSVCMYVRVQSRYERSPAVRLSPGAIHRSCTQKARLTKWCSRTSPVRLPWGFGASTRVRRGYVRNVPSWNLHRGNIENGRKARLFWSGARIRGVLAGKTGVLG